MKRTSKLKSKLCAWLLVCATVLTTFGSTGSVVFANDEPTEQQTETELATLSVKSGEGGEIRVELPDGQVETASNGNDVNLEVEINTTVTATITLAEGYEVSTYRLTTDSGDSKDIDVYDSFSFDISENTTLEASYSVISTEPTETEVAETPETPDTTPVEEDQEVTEEADSNSSDIVVPDDEITSVLDGTYGLGATNAISLFSADDSDKYTDFQKERLTLEYRRTAAANSLAASRATTWCSITPGKDHHYGSWNTCEFRVDKEGVISQGYCAEPNSDTPDGVFQAYQLNNDQLKAILMFAPGGPLFYQEFWETYGQNPATGGVDGNDAYSLAHACIGLEYSGQTTGLSQTDIDEIRGYIGLCDVGYCKQQKEWNEYIAYIAYNDDQDVIWLEKNPEKYTSLTVTKQWNDNNNQYGARPSSIKVNLHRWEGTRDESKVYKTAYLTPANNWTYTWSNELKQDANHNYSFSVTEEVPAHYKCSNQAWTGNTTDGYHKVLINTVQTGKLNMKKISSNSSLTSGNSNYSYSGAQYGVYTNANATGTPVGTLTIDSSGNSNTLTLLSGTYYVKETKASKGYMLDTTIHRVTVTDNNTATFTSSEPPMSVKINLTKVSNNSKVTNNNDLYSLKGAEYSIYRNSSCTQYVTKITTDANGKGSISNLPLNIYYMKETKASQGFGKDTKVYTIDARTGTTLVVQKSVTSTEPCLMDPIGLLIQKVDAETGNKVPVDEGTLQDARFEVKFYDTVMNTDPGAAGHTPIYSWVMRTDSNGIIQLNNSYVVSGGNIPTSSSGNPSLPYGTITFKEIKSPSGYLLNSTVIVQKITGTNGSLTTVPQYSAPTQKEQPMTLKIIKVQNGTTLRIPDAQFKWTLPDGTTHTYKTNSNGEVSFKGLEWGKHTIEEVKVPDGYSVNKNKITFTVNQDNTITGVSGATVTDTDGNFTLVINENNLNPTVTYENKPAPFDLHVYKINDVDFALQGAEFTIYTDAACKNVWKKGTTDSSGNLTFEDLIVGKTYYMKETKAPQGYRIPINDDGSDIVYTIRVTSTPVKNEFTFYVNGKAYTTASTGNYSVSGSKANRICDMTIINDRGKQLPETGSSMMLVLVIAGVALMGGAIVVSQTRKSKKEQH